MVRRIFGIAVVVIFLAMTAATAMANGGTVQLSNVQAGPYQVSVFTSPSPIRVGRVDVSVLVQKPASTETEQDAVVMVSADPVGRQGKSETFEATHDQATNKLYYAANVDLPSEGRWRIEATVLGPLGDGAVSFEVEATRESLTDQPLLLAGLIAAPVVLVLGWIVLRGRGGEPTAPGGKRE